LLRERVGQDGMHLRAGKHEDVEVSHLGQNLGQGQLEQKENRTKCGRKRKRNENLEPGSKLHRMGCAVEMVSLCKTFCSPRASSAGMD